jgi:putative SOS response-associated peptidase YedK
VASKPAFRDAFARGQRCIVPVDAFYEWKKIGASKQPYAIVGADGLPLALAGLWERWKDRVSGATRCKLSPSSRRHPTTSAPRYTIACQSSFRERNG